MFGINLSWAVHFYTDASGYGAGFDSPCQIENKINPKEKTDLEKTFNTRSKMLYSFTVLTFQLRSLYLSTLCTVWGI